MTLEKPWNPWDYRDPGRETACTLVNTPDKVKLKAGTLLVVLTFRSRQMRPRSSEVVCRNHANGMFAYLVIREDANWSDVFRLIPGQTVTIGRAPTNQVVVKDERCSRAHAEIFMADGQWTLRDLESRNGTAVGNRLVEEDYHLKPGDVIRIGRSRIDFVHDLSHVTRDGASKEVDVSSRPVTEEAADPTGDDSHIFGEQEAATITHRRGQTRLLRPSADDAESGSSSRLGPAAAKLARLAFELAQAPDIETIAKMALDGLFSGTPVDGGAILLAPDESEKEMTSTDLKVVASRSDSKKQYYRVSPFLVATALRDGEAVLARNVMGDSTLARRDSQGHIHATSVICAPIRCEGKPTGIMHLYSSDEERVIEPDDLEFTLAVADTVGVALSNLRGREKLNENLIKVRDENVQLREQLQVQSEIVGHSAVAQRLNEQIARVAPSNATVLVRGESGVGKELVARAVHFSSRRKDQSFICLNCAALSETLLESELFGHEKGAFTGATERKIGKFEAADKGTLMLDEIGEMSPAIQAKFLRVLEGHPFERVGGSTAVNVDVRVIAATNRDLEKDVTAGTFRRDLFFRLHVLEILVPPLRKRPDDIPELALYFLKKFNLGGSRRILGFTPSAMEQMQRYRWPGNVRELRNVIERACALSDSEYIDEHDLMLTKLATSGDTSEMNIEGAYKPESLSEVERRHILATLNATHWNKSQSAQILGIERSTLDRKIRRYDLGKRSEQSAR